MPGIELERHGSTALITVENSEVKNALNPDLARELIAVCEEIDADVAIGAAVIRGAGGTFCSGADRRNLDSQVDQTEDSAYQDAGAIYRSFHRFGKLGVPTIAAVRGAVVGAGLNLMLAADLRVVAHNSKILAGFLDIGLHPGGGFFALAGRVAGRETAAAMGLFSERYDGAAAVAVGLAYQSVDDDQVENRALELAGRAARDPALSRVALASFRAELGPPAMDWDVAINYERPSQMWSLHRRTH